MFFTFGGHNFSTVQQWQSFLLTTDRLEAFLSQIRDLKRINSEEGNYPVEHFWGRRLEEIKAELYRRTLKD